MARLSVSFRVRRPTRGLRALPCACAAALLAILLPVGAFAQSQPGGLKPKSASSSSRTTQDATPSSAGEAKTQKPEASSQGAAESESDVSEKPTDATSAENSKAPQDLERPITDPETRALLVRAEEHYYRERHHIALKLFQLVIEREPEHALAYRYAGDIYLKRRELDLAEEHLQIARELSAHPEQEWFRLGQVAYLRSDADGAERAFERALKLKPDFVVSRFYLGFVSYRLKRDKQQTIDHWENYLLLAPQDPQAPAIARAIEILRDPAYEIPDFSKEDGEPQLPESADGADTRVPYQPGRDENEKSDNTGEEIINIDDL